MWRPKQKGKPPISTLKPRESFSSYCSILLFSTVSSRIRLNCSKLVNGVSCSTVGSGNLVRSIKISPIQTALPTSGSDLRVSKQPWQVIHCSPPSRYSCNTAPELKAMIRSPIRPNPRT
ncbi:hypothetical protein AABB24_003703 [Solanum stoloniferum]|uniref:Uncharacterized protein n=1 Tax=Solanum stoloniferum TaxID=62892 RepID=A0ABD2V8T6_9SOLN